VRGDSAVAMRTAWSRASRAFTSMDVVQKYVPPARLPNTDTCSHTAPCAFLTQPVSKSSASPPNGSDTAWPSRSKPATSASSVRATSTEKLVALMRASLRCSALPSGMLSRVWN